MDATNYSVHGKVFLSSQKSLDQAHTSSWLKMGKKSTIHGTSVSYEDSTRENNSRENMYTRHRRSTIMIK